jgi:hypothetical protein
MNSTKKAVKAVNVVKEKSSVEYFKNVKNSISGLIGISKKENEVQLSRRAESLKLFEFFHLVFSKFSALLKKRKKCLTCNNFFK